MLSQIQHSVNRMSNETVGLCGAGDATDVKFLLRFPSDSKSLIVVVV